MRVAFDVAPLRAAPTGVGVFAWSMAHALADELPDDDLVLLGVHESALALPEGPHRTRFRGRGYIAWLQLRAPSEVRRLHADIGHFSDGICPILPRGPTVVSIHDLSVVRAWRTHPVRRWLRIPLALAAPHLADLVIVPSRATADELVRLAGADARKVEVVPYAPRRGMVRPDDMAIERVLARLRLERDRYVLALGTIEPRKNHARLVEAFELAIASDALPHDIDLVVAGSLGWRAKPIIERMARSSVAQRIRRVGYVAPDDLASLLSGAAAVAYPSLYEGFGLPVVEAMACGAATVTSNISSMPEVTGDSAFLVDPYDPRDIARGLTEAVRAARGDRSRIAASSIAQASNFSWQKAARAVISLYREHLR